MRQPYDWELWLDHNVPLDHKGPFPLKEGAPEEIKKKYEEAQRYKIKESKERRALLRRHVIQAIEYQFEKGLELSQEDIFLSATAMIDLIANCNEQGEWNAPRTYIAFHSGEATPSKNAL